MKAVANQGNRGMEFESELETIHQYYEMAGRALINKVPVKTLVKGSENGKAHALVIGQGLSDYLGALKGGRCIALEAKQTIEKNFSIRYLQKSHNTIAPHQMEYLQKMDRMGALALWGIYFARERTMFVIRHRQMQQWIPDLSRPTKMQIGFEAMKSLPLQVCRSVENGWNGLSYLDEIKDWLDNGK